MNTLAPAFKHVLQHPTLMPQSPSNKGFGGVGSHLHWPQVLPHACRLRIRPCIVFNYVHSIWFIPWLLLTERKNAMLSTIPYDRHPITITWQLLEACDCANTRNSMVIFDVTRYQVLLVQLIVNHLLLLAIPDHCWLLLAVAGDQPSFLVSNSCLWLVIVGYS